eukprot:14595235-Alexandrium_andersonii.AAC.1
MKNMRAAVSKYTSVYMDELSLITSRGDLVAIRPCIESGDFSGEGIAEKITQLVGEGKFAAKSLGFAHAQVAATFMKRYIEQQL